MAGTKPHNTSPLGYLIVLSGGVRIHDTSRPYYGVDRLPPIIAPDPAIRDFLGEPLVDDPALKNALDEWMDMVTEPPFTPILRSYERARRLLDSLQSLYALELLLCELAWQEGEEDRVCAYPRLEGGRGDVVQTYGYDVSWPGCNHSAIRQPGVVSYDADWMRRLNQWGLLDSYEDAVHLREMYLRCYPYPPFDVFVVHDVGSAEPSAVKAD
jgi:hypothetical protein